MADPVNFGGTSSVDSEGAAATGFPSLPIRLSSVSLVDSAEASKDQFSALIIRFGGLSLTLSTPPGITGVAPYDEMAAIFNAAGDQSIITASPYDESADRVADINAALGLTPPVTDEKADVVEGWLV